ncbi:2Fe-2S iron-sulfur cluster binding domain protein [Collimonas arenae]|uniref:2Fe-2S iron-sulfur cluster binding domain protein n=1 Tax=Collimonas arenae TaxID=279058 RepID=A0A127QPB9_9BURK|nr:2Fe-2S iron-sulfur cluster binding domain-containing protein [Collimonas arenae]AMP02016.1 2Fe-2S iron-sulfur cluster binding domain protein [Collimonas arenae]AMP11913.1 2Fe-2S iron-sulfur cluster binding domain protein [Collimonas arenae]
MSADDKKLAVRITPKDWTFDTSATMPLLEAARLARIDLPSSCRNGTCRTCMCRLLTGTISYQIEWPGLSSDEKRDGYILPCVAFAESDLVIEEPRARRCAAPGKNSS